MLPTLNLFIRYLEIVETLYENMVEDMNRADFTVGDKYRSKYDELGKTTTSATLQANTTFALLPFPNLLGFLIILSCVFDIWTI
jgi:CRISPR/Cas system endoribonuclease Cas6 (RAMP superfamily)